MKVSVAVLIGIGALNFITLEKAFCLSKIGSAVNSSCPTRFIGVVTKLQEPKTPFNSLAKMTVTFNGEVELQVLKYGHFKPKLNETYRLATRDGKLCFYKKL